MKLKCRRMIFEYWSNKMQDQSVNFVTNFWLGLYLHSDQQCLEVKITLNIYIL